MSPDSGAEAIVAVLRRRLEERRRDTYRKPSPTLAASLELGSQMELRDFVALLDVLEMSLDDLSGDLAASRSLAAADEPAAALGGVGMDSWLEEIRRIRKRLDTGGRFAGVAGKADPSG